MAIPQLLPNGANWVLYKRRIDVALQPKPKLRRHLEGREPAPTPPTPIASTATNDEKKAYAKKVAEYNEKADEWEASDGLVIQQIVGSIPDAVFIRIQHQIGRAHV